MVALAKFESSAVTVTLGLGGVQVRIRAFCPTIETHNRRTAMPGEVIGRLSATDPDGGVQT